MRRLWFIFKNGPATLTAVKYGCGVTAHDREDAEEILKETIFVGDVILPIEKCVEDIDISTLDSGHVIPNIGDNIFKRGVWFPQGYKVE
jgi:hypothetical protein